MTEGPAMGFAAYEWVGDNRCPKNKITKANIAKEKRAAKHEGYSRMYDFDLYAEHLGWYLYGLIIGYHSKRTDLRRILLNMPCVKFPNP
jgi:hypothetical protein